MAGCWWWWSALRTSCRGLRTKGVAVKAELMPGIPMGRVLGGAADGARLITKAGGFGDEAALVQAVGHLRGG